MKIRNLENIIKQLKPKLHEYLELNGIDPTKQFTCINPNHDDRNPSCSANGGDNTLFRCLSQCGAAGDIFHAAHYLEGKPLIGNEFVEENVAYLAERFGIEFEEEPLSEEEIYRIQTYRAYASTASMVSIDSCSEAVGEEIKRRGWDGHTCRKYGVGSIPVFKEFRAALKTQGFSAAFQNDVDLGREDIFSHNNLIFTIRDTRGRPVGFVARNLTSIGPKYNNQKTTGLKCNIYKKSTRLFGLDIFLKERKKDTEPVYIFEGYSDVITAAQHGVYNCVALGCSDMSPEQLQVLKEQNIYRIIIALDGDKTGRDKTVEMLDKTLSGHKDLRIEIVVLPPDTDPDELIRNKGVDVFKKLKKWSAFEWRLNQFDPTAEDDVICEGMIPFIVNEPSHVIQDKLCKLLAKATGVDLKSIKAEVERLQNKREAEKAKHKQRIIDGMVVRLQRSSEEADSILFETQSALLDLAKQYEKDSFSEESLVCAIQQQKQAEEVRTLKDAGFELGDDLRTIRQTLRGEWTDTWWCIAADENCGKTALMSKLAISIASKEENDAMVIYHTIDDTKEQIIPRCVCILEGTKSLSINQVSIPAIWNELPHHRDILSKRDDGYTELIKLARDGRIIIKDANDGATLAYADRLIKYYKNKYPKRRVVYILDNFHKLNEFQNSGSDDRNRYKRTSEATKRLATSNHATVLTTVEYRKAQGNSKMNRKNDEMAECLTGDTLVYDATSGQQIRIDEVKEGMYTHTIDRSTQKIVKQKITKLWDKGVAPVYKVTLEDGRSVKTTANHPFLNDKSWTKLSDLQVGDWVGVPRIIPTKQEHSTEKEKDRARLLGLLAGDGSYASYNTPSFINKTPEYYENAERIALKEFGIKAHRSQHNGSTNLSFGYKIGNPNPLTTWLKLLGIHGQVKEHKDIPQWIYKAPLDVKAEYIAGLFETDGTITGKDGKQRRISFTNKSKHIIYGLHSLLLQFGILSSVHNVPDGLLRVNVKNTHIGKFALVIPVTGYKKDELLAAAKDVSTTNSGDFLPPQFVNLAKGIRKLKGLPVRYSNNLYYIGKNQTAVNRTTAQMIASDEQDCLLKAWAHSDIYWTKIKSIEPLGEEQVWDLTVEGTHNFIANNIFCHNTNQISYDANVVIHLWNDIHENGDLAKHTHSARDPETGDFAVMPRIRARVGKNKISTFKGDLWLDFFPASSDWGYTSTPTEVQQETNTVADRDTSWSPFRGGE